MKKIYLPYLIIVILFSFLGTANAVIIDPLVPTVTYPPPSVTWVSPGVLGQPYSSTFQVVGGLTPYTFSISAGSLPPGITLGQATGTISGTPTTSDTFTFTVQVTGDDLVAGTREFTLTRCIWH